MANLPLAFAELLGGGVLLTAGLAGATIQDVFAGNIQLGAPASKGSGAGASSATSSGPGSDQQVRSWVKQGLELAGVPATKANIDTVAGRVMQESGGDPNAVNNWDSNAKAGHPSKGLLQTIDATFGTYAVPGHQNIFDPVDNVAAAVNYMLARYGHLVGAGQGGY